MTTRGVSGLVVALVALVGLVGVAPASAQAPDPPGAANPAPGEEKAVPEALGAEVVSRFENGCGGHCATMESATSKVLLRLAADGTARATDAGKRDWSFSTPDGVSSKDTRWALAWEGRWTREGAALVLTLAPTGTDCTAESRDFDPPRETERRAESCADKVVALTLRCEPKSETVQPAGAPPTPIGIGRAPAGAAPGQPAPTPAPTRRVVWTCAADGDTRGASLPGTALPWGLSERDGFHVYDRHVGPGHYRTFVDGIAGE